MATVTRADARLQLDCGHSVTVPLDDELAFSFVGSETDCPACRREAAGKILDDLWNRELNRPVCSDCGRAGILENFRCANCRFIGRLDS